MSAVPWGVVHDVMIFMRHGVPFLPMHACSVAAAVSTGPNGIENDVSRITS